ncbi:MAG TPA: mercury resistance system transport protein MerF [Burkholderiales bacterium]|nr:mercury resistance system transport protein MerF [Burkholderiales bacterium]
MDRKRLLGTGIAGAIVAAICCFTPALVLLLGAVGLGALIEYLDYVLFPAFAFFIGLVVYALVRKRA